MMFIIEKKTLTRILIYVLASLLFIWLNPFGLYSYTSRESRDMVQAFMSHFYPSERRTDISVILFDEKSPEVITDQPGASWPLGYKHHANLLNMILEDGPPKAVFVDIFYQRNDEDGAGIKELLKTADRYAAADVPLIIADLSDGKSGCGSIVQPGLLPTFETARANGFSDYNSHGEIYRIQSKDTCRMPFAAIAMYKHACKDMEIDPSWLDTPGIPDICMQWGLYSDPRMGMVTVPGHGIEIKPQNSNWDTITYLYRSLIRGIKGRETPCLLPYHASIPVSIFSRLYFPTDKDDPELFFQRYEEIAGSLVKDRYLFIGTGISTIPDIVRSPIHGFIPGVYVHAMAFDNLLTYGKDYWQNPQPLIGDINYLNFVEITIFCVSLWIYTHYIAAKGDRRWEKFMITILYLFGLVVISLVICCILGRFFNLSPYNFVGLLTSLTTIILARLESPLKKTIDNMG